MCFCIVILHSIVQHITNELRAALYTLHLASHLLKGGISKHGYPWLRAVRCFLCHSSQSSQLPCPRAPGYTQYAQWQLQYEGTCHHHPHSDEQEDATPLPGPLPAVAALHCHCDSTLPRDDTPYVSKAQKSIRMANA